MLPELRLPNAAGNFYLTGGTYGPLGGPYRGGGDAWVAKYDAAGRPLWKRQLGTAENDAAFGVARDDARKRGVDEIMVIGGA